MKRVVFALFALGLPVIAMADPLSVCVRKNGVMHMVGPSFKRQACKPNETAMVMPGATAERGFIAALSPSIPDALAMSLVEAAGINIEVGTAAVATITLDNGIRALLQDGRVFRLNQGDFSSPNPLGWTEETGFTLTVPVNTLATWGVSMYIDLQGRLWRAQIDGPNIIGFVQEPNP